MDENTTQLNIYNLQEKRDIIPQEEIDMDKD